MKKFANKAITIEYYSVNSYFDIGNNTSIEKKKDISDVMDKLKCIPAEKEKLIIMESL